MITCPRSRRFFYSYLIFLTPKKIPIGFHSMLFCPNPRQSDKKILTSINEKGLKINPTQYDFIRDFYFESAQINFSINLNPKSKWFSWKTRFWFIRIKSKTYFILEPNRTEENSIWNWMILKNIYIIRNYNN